MLFLSSSRAVLLSAFVATLSIIGLQPAMGAALPFSLVPRGFNGMGMASLVLAVIDFLKGENAYVSRFPAFS